MLTQANCVDLFMRHINQSLTLFEATSEWLSQDKTETTGKKPNTRKLCPVIVEVLKKLYNMETIIGAKKNYYTNIIQPPNA